MKKLDRNPEKFEALEALNAFSSKNKYNLFLECDIERFLKSFSESLQSSLKNQNLLHGKRIEMCFSQVAAALGYCKLIKNEDCGDVICDIEEIAVPDYRITLKNGSQIFVEVKNFNSTDINKAFRLRKNYLVKLQNYSNLNNIVLYFAIYYRRLNTWIMLQTSSFTETEKHFEIDLVNAFKKNEMAILGDMTIATIPPLVLELISDNTEKLNVNKDKMTDLTINTINIYAGENKIKDNHEKNIAFYLMKFSNWVLEEPKMNIVPNNIVSLSYIFSPESLDNFEKNGFIFLGNLSSMITRAFNEQTLDEKNIISIASNTPSNTLIVKIPHDYNSATLKLWRFTVEANFED